MSMHSEWNKLYIAHLRAKGVPNEKIQEMLAPVNFEEHMDWGSLWSQHHPINVAETHYREKYRRS